MQNPARPNGLLLKLTFALAMLNSVMLATCLLGMFMQSMRASKASRVSVGMTENEVLERLGTPDYSYLPGEQVHALAPRKSTTGKLLVYYGSYIIIFVYLDRELMAECIFIEDT
jgi:hypothetical protein